MLKREHIKQAIDAIARQDQEIGYVLDEMLGLGRIGPPAPLAEALPGEGFCFAFDDQLAVVRKGTFFEAGSAAIEERLLIKYGELLKRHDLVRDGRAVDYRAAASQIRQAGLGFLVNHELIHAAAKPKARKKDSAILAARYREIQKIQDPLHITGNAGETATGTGVLFRGTVAGGKAAYFMPFPFCRDALVQVADLNLDFFPVRFLLGCLARGVAGNVFACVVENRIEGLVYLTFREQLFYRAMEIHYIATTRGRPEAGAAALKGVGTFLVAGVWMLWKGFHFRVKELLLDSEIGARGFYTSVGFESRGLSCFVMKNPGGRLVKGIVDMATASSVFDGNTVKAIVRLIQRQVGLLRKRSGGDHAAPERRLALGLVNLCLQPESHPAFGQAAVAGLRRYRRQIPEADDLLAHVGNG